MASCDYLHLLLTVLVTILRQKLVTGVSMENCNIPATSAASANRSPVRFTISQIQSEPSWLFKPVQIENYLYTVQYCHMTLYAVSKITEYNPLLEGQKLSDQRLSCRSLDGSATEVSGRILRYFDDKVSKPGDVPAEWYEGGRMVLQIIFFKFPHKSTLKIRCGVKNTAGISIEIFADAMISKIGCPKSKWGTRCQFECQCQNGGVCHTFDGTCSCPDGYDGVKCEIHYWSTKKTEGVTKSNTRQTTAPPDFPAPGNTNEDKPSTREVASDKENDVTNSSSQLTIGWCLLIAHVILFLCTVLLSR